MTDKISPRNAPIAPPGAKTKGSVKQFGIRMKGSEKFWNGFGQGMGAEEMFALLVLQRSEDGRWEDYWRRRSRPYTREPRKKEGA